MSKNGFSECLLKVCEVYIIFIHLNSIKFMPTLQWIGKEKVINHHLDVPYRVLDHQYSLTPALSEGEGRRKF